MLKTYLIGSGLCKTSDYPDIGTARDIHIHIHITDATVGQHFLPFCFRTLSHVRQKGNIIGPFQNPSLLTATLFLYRRIKFDQRACCILDEDCIGDVDNDGKALILVFMFTYTAFLVSSSAFH